MSKRRRILLYSDAETFAGGERYMLELARGLSGDSFDVRCVTATAPGADPFTHALTESGLPVKRLPRVVTLDQARKLFTVFKHFLRRRYDLIHFNLVDPRACNAAMTAAACALQGRIIVTEHLPESPFDDKPLPFRHKVAARATRITIVNSSDHRRVVENRPWNRSRVIVIPNGLPDPGGPRQELREAAREAMGAGTWDGPVVGLVGRLQPQKNPLLFLEGAARVLKTRRDVLFVVIGDGDLGTEVERAVTEMGIGDNVRLLGWRDDAQNLMYGLDLLVNTSRYEGQPLTLLEAMLRAVPVCVQRISGMEDFVADRASGRVVPPEDGDALGAALVEMLASREDLRAFGQVARERTLTLFSIRGMCRKTADAYLELLDGTEAAEPVALEVGTAR